MAGSRIRLYGATSGYVELAPPAVSPDAVLTLPPTFAGVGTNVVQTVKTDTFSTASGAFVAVTGLTVTITPTSAASKVLIIANIALSHSANNSLVVRLRRGASTALGSGISGTSNGFAFGQGPTLEKSGICFLDSPATTSATTYAIDIATASATAYVNRRGADTFQGASSDITAIEVAA